MTKAKPMKLAAMGVASLLAFTVPAPAQTPGLALLDGLQLGEWTLTPRGSRDPATVGPPPDEPPARASGRD